MTSEELKAQILNCARKHFATHGFQGTSLKEIAKESGIANSLLNYHFKDKEGLFKACFEPFAQTRMEAIQRILGEVKSAEEFRIRIELFVDEMVSAVIADPFGFEIMDREVRALNQIVLGIFENTLLVAFKAVVGFFDQAKRNKVIRQELDPLICAGLLFSCCCDGARKQVLAKTYFDVSLENPDFRKKHVNHIVSLFTHGVTA